MQALGMIETRGTLAAIEAVDVMLKAADVVLSGRTLVGGGLVTVCVSGDVGAVKASVDAGEAAVLHLGKDLLISRHVIPRPDAAIAGILPSNGPDKPDPPDPVPSKEGLALAEERDIILLDEWAADQDPHFRREFYQVLLPLMHPAQKPVLVQLIRCLLKHGRGRILRRKKKPLRFLLRT